ncbi:MAG: carbohydrate ABC transporter permease [Clostridia bacterium]|nr:carbohydrate ABC transporter permease [Clostridia bacterium]
MIKIKTKMRKFIPQFFLHLIMIVSLFMVLYPLLMMIFGTFKSGTEYNANKWLPALPLRITNVSDAFVQIDSYLWNTVFVAVVGIGGLIFIASMAAFAMTKLKFVGSSVCFAMIMALTMMPGVLSMTSQFLLYQGLGLQNSLFALILPMWTSGCVFGVFLLKGFYGGLPNELFEAAELDGAGSFQKYVLIAIPLSLPIIATLVIMQITNVWNDLLWPRLILNSENYTIAAGLAFSFETVSTIAQPIKFAGYFVASIPVVLLFIFFNRFYVEGLASSGIKL